MFAEREYAATAMQDIAAELGLTRAALYYHHPAKADILKAIIEGETARFSAALDDIVALPTRPARIDAAVVVYRPSPTTEQLWAVNVAFMSFAALPSFARLTRDELVPILTGALRRLLRLR